MTKPLSYFQVTTFISIITLGAFCITSQAQSFDPWERASGVQDACREGLDEQREDALNRLLLLSPIYTADSTGILRECGWNYNAWSSSAYYLKGCSTGSFVETIACDQSYCTEDVQICGGFTYLFKSCDEYYAANPDSNVTECTKVSFVMSHPDEKSCPEGEYFDAMGSCTSIEPYSNADNLCTAGNPIDVNLGNKIEHAVDYILPGPTPFAFSRTYNSINKGWTFSTDRTFSPVISESSEVKLLAYRPDGSVANFILQGDDLISEIGVIENFYFGSFNLKFKDRKSGHTEVYYPDGSLGHIEYPNGSLLLTSKDGYSSNSSLNPYHIAKFIRDSQGRITAIKDGYNNTKVSYHFDGYGNLKKVTYPGGHSIEYLYGNSVYPHALTGYLNADGQKVAEWQYDSEGRATSSAHFRDGELVDSYQINLIHESSTERISEVTNQNGKKTRYYYEKVNGEFRIKRVEGLASENCLASNSEYSYYSNGDLLSITFNNGNVTEYEYNDRRLVTKITEAAGSDVERITYQEWHEDSYLLLSSDNGFARTEYTYDEAGMLIEAATVPSLLNNL